MQLSQNIRIIPLTGDRKLDKKAIKRKTKRKPKRES